MSAAAPLARPIDEPAAIARGWYDTVTLDNPAAGADAVYTVDPRYFERVVSVTFHYLASAAAANRTPRVRLESPTGRLLGGGTPGGQLTAAQASDVVIGPGLVAAGTFLSGFVTAPLGDIELVPGSVVRVGSANIDAGDQISAVTIVVQRFSTGDRAREREPDRKRRRGR